MRLNNYRLAAAAAVVAAFFAAPAWAQRPEATPV